MVSGAGSAGSSGGGGGRRKSFLRTEDLPGEAMVVWDRVGDLGISVLADTLP